MRYHHLRSRNNAACWLHVHSCTPKRDLILAQAHCRKKGFSDRSQTGSGRRLGRSDDTVSAKVLVLIIDVGRPAETSCYMYLCSLESLWHFLDV